MKDSKLDQLAKNLDDQSQKDPNNPNENSEEEIEMLPDEMAEKLAGGQNRGCTCTNSGCSC